MKPGLQSLERDGQTASEVIRALFLRLGSKTALARKLGISRTTLDGWWNDCGLPAPIVLLMEKKRKELAKLRRTP